MNSILEVQNLTKYYGKTAAVNHVNFSIEKGICFGLLGPNGAGKTTAVEMMEGIRPPDEGSILFAGKPVDKEFKHRIGIQFQSTALPEFITVKETLSLFRSFYRSPRSMDDLIEICSLEDILHKDNQKISGGQRQRLLLALALAPRPEIVFLDEPTTGLDPQSRRNFWELIQTVKAEQATIILTTHYMDEAEILCDTIAIMDKGEILELDSPNRLLDKHFAGGLIRLPKNPDILRFIEAAASQENTVLPNDDYIEIQTAETHNLLYSLIEQGVELNGLAVHRPDLEDLFIKLTGSSLRV